jgi:hypothetical protein
VGGVSYDNIRFPLNYRFAPITDDEDRKDQVSPKAGIVWTPARGTTVRGAYARSLGGVSIDQSFQLEPSQVAGFNQVYRSLIPESAAGPTTVPEFSTWAVSLEQKFPTGTYLGLSGELLQSEANRTIGVYEVPATFIPVEASTREHLDYRERTVLFTVNQLVGQRWSLGGRYRFSTADLNDDLVSLPAVDDDVATRQDLESTLHQLTASASYTHSCGFFALFEASWYSQINHGYEGTRPGDEFWQLNLLGGYRFLQRRGELRIGVLNLTDEDYRLNPLNLTSHLPRDRTFVTSLRLNF